MLTEGSIQARYRAIGPVVDERVRRLVLAAEALAAGRGGQAAVARATGASRGTIRRGIRELGQPTGGAEKGRMCGQRVVPCPKVDVSLVLCGHSILVVQTPEHWR